MHRSLVICSVVVALLTTSAASGQTAGSVPGTRAGSRPTQGRRLLDEAARERGALHESAPVAENRGAEPAGGADTEFPTSDPFEFATPTSVATKPTQRANPVRQARPGVATAAYHEPIAPDSSSTNFADPSVESAELDTRGPSGANAEHEGQEVSAETLAPDLLPTQPLATSTPSGSLPLDASTDASMESATKLAEATVPANSAESLQLAPRGDVPTGTNDEAPQAASEDAEGPSGSPLMTMLGSLALVLALFFAVVWIMRRAMPPSSRQLPLDVIEVLGRTPLPGKQQQMQLVRLGNKLLLLATSTSGVQPLAEITDPDEVDRLARLCRGERYESPVTPFGDSLEELARKRTGRRFDDEPVETAASALSRRLGRSPRLEGSDV